MPHTKIFGFREGMAECFVIAEKNWGNAYAFGFNGKENDNEVKGLGNQQDYGMRIYDNRLGRFLSVDPLSKVYPMLTPYQFASNTPIQAIDLDGAEADVVVAAQGWKSGDSKLFLQRAENIKNESFGFSMVKEALNGEQLLTLFKTLTNEYGSIGNMAVLGHGSENQILMSGDYSGFLRKDYGFDELVPENTSSNTAELKAAILSKDIVFESSSTIVLATCNSYADAEGGEMNLAESIASLLPEGASVIAADGQVSHLPKNKYQDSNTLSTSGSFYKLTSDGKGGFSKESIGEQFDLNSLRTTVKVQEIQPKKVQLISND